LGKKKSNPWCNLIQQTETHLICVWNKAGTVHYRPQKKKQFTSAFIVSGMSMFICVKQTVIYLQRVRRKRVIKSLFYMCTYSYTHTHRATFLF